MKMSERNVYLDHAAATPISPKVQKAMWPFFGKVYGNPGALHGQGLRAATAMEDNKKKIADLLRAVPDNLIFTSGGTEANNLAIMGAALGNQKYGRHVITTNIEHQSILDPGAKLKQQDFVVTYIKVNKFGLVDPKEVIGAIRKDTVIISIMYANNEIGAIEPIAEIGRKLLRYRKENKTNYPYLHTDACQAAGYLNLEVEKLHVDLMTLNANKICGPKGVGLLYKRKGVKLEPQLLGGNQEHGLRAGTENLPGIVGLTTALAIVEKKKDKESKRIQNLTKSLYKKIKRIVPNCKLNGPEFGLNRLPNNLNITLPRVEAEKFLLYLDAAGIMCSTGSACTALTAEPSHVLKAIGLTPNDVNSTLRFSLGPNTKTKDIEYVVSQFNSIYNKFFKPLAS